MEPWEIAGLVLLVGVFSLLIAFIVVIIKAYTGED